MRLNERNRNMKKKLIFVVECDVEFLNANHQPEIHHFLEGSTLVVTVLDSTQDDIVIATNNNSIGRVSLDKVTGYE
jgi:hypothetical protein